MTLYGKVELKDLGGNTYVLGSENRGYSVEMHKDKAHVFRLESADPQDVFKDRYVVGGEVTVYCDSSNPPATKIFNGVIENIVRKDVFGTRRLSVQATEKFFVKASGILVTDRFSSKKAGWIAKTLISNYTSGFTTTNIQDTDVTVNSVTFNHRQLKECLDRLAEISGAVWYCTANGDVYFHPKETVESGLSLTESMVKPIPVVKRSLEALATVVEVHGGFSLDLDQSQQTVSSGPVSLHDRDVAVKFTPTKGSGRYLELYLDKVGSPSRALSGRIVEDSAGQPSGVAREFFAYGESEFTEAGWHGLKIDVELDTAKSYWIVLNRCGDVSNTYRWYHDGSSTSTHAEKTNGVWTVYNGTSWRSGFKIYGGEPVIGKAVDSVQYSTYGCREFIVEREDVTHKEDAVRIAQQILADKSRVKLEFDKLKVRGDLLSSLPQPGKLANLALSSLNFNGKVVVEDLSIMFPEGSETVEEVVFTVGEDPESLAAVLKTLEEKLEEEKRKGLGDDTLLRIAELFQESLPLADTLTAKEPGHLDHPVLTESVGLSDSLMSSQQTSGTFVEGFAHAGFSDAG